MSNPRRFLIRCAIFLALALGVAVVLSATIWKTFQFNPWLNGLIMTVLLAGIFYNFRRIWSLRVELEWIDGYNMGTLRPNRDDAPRLVAPIAAVLADTGRRQQGGTALSTITAGHLLDSVGSRLDETRDIARYQTGLMIFLGLLGTFWGLIEAIDSIGAVITGLSIGTGDFAAVFEDMKTGLARPISGMGTAFGASLFGLAGSLVLGFLDLQATQAQNGFFDELEAWIGGITRHQTADLVPTTAGVAQLQPVRAMPKQEPMPAYIHGLLQQTAENMQQLSTSLGRDEDSRERLHAVLDQMVDRLTVLGDRVGREQEALIQLATAQQAILDELGRRAIGTSRAAAGLDEATLAHLRNTDLQLGRILDEITRSRSEMVREIRGEIRLVAKTIAVVAGDPELVPE